MTAELRADIEQFIELLAAKGDSNVKKSGDALRRHLNQNSDWIAHHAVICLKTIRYSPTYTLKFNGEDWTFVTELLRRVEDWQNEQ